MTTNSEYLFSGGGGGAAEYQIERSVRFNSADSAYLSRTPSVAGNRKTWTWAGWVKRSALGTAQNLFGTTDATANTTSLYYNGSTDTLQFYQFTSGSFNGNKVTTQVYRDTSAWMHVVAVWDTTNATASDRMRLYINGERVTDFGTSSDPTLNSDSRWNQTVFHSIGRINTYYYLDGYLADIHFIDGQALDPTSFGKFDTNGVWQPKAYTGSYGTNGFHLPFSDNSTSAALGTDTSGNGNDWTVNNISASTGGPYPIASASGALPIYNTTDPYGTTKGTGTRTDANASSLVLAIPMDGANNGTTFTDESATIKGSGSPKSITSSTTVTSTTRSKYYGSSAYFNGSSSSLGVSSSADFSFGTANFTVECWVYLNSYGGGGYNHYFSIQTQNTFALKSWANSIYLAANYGVAVTTSSGPTLNKWIHLAVVRNGSTITIYVDGIASGSASTSASFGANAAATVGAAAGASSEFLDGYMQDLRVYKGVAKYTSNFNPPTNTQNSAVAVACDSLVDTPTNYGTDTGLGGEVRGNYCTLNPLNNPNASTLTNGNLDLTTASTGGGLVDSTIAVSSGKWYWELLATSVATSLYVGIKLASEAIVASSGLPSVLGYTAGSYAYANISGNKVANSVASSYGSSWTTNDIIGVALDLDAGTLVFYKNGVSQGIAFSGLSGAFTPAFSDGGAGTSALSANFGQRPFAYTAPSGFKALCTTNLPDPTIADGSTAMDALLYTGNGSTAQRTISGYNFSPDLVWVKDRSAGNWHQLRSTLQSGVIFSNDTSQEVTNYTNGFVEAITSSGFQLSTASNPIPVLNTNGSAYVAWAWDAGSSTVTNNDGTITSQVRANPSAGFSIVSWTGTGADGTIGHGLGVPPVMYILKARNAASDWLVFTTLIDGSVDYLYLNTTAAAATTGGGFSIAPTSSVISLGFAPGANALNEQDIAYCFAPVEGYSAFGSYTGNGSGDGPFVYTGFRPRFIMWKLADGAGNWTITDSTRSPYNAVYDMLLPNLSNAESTYSNAFAWDYLSNGFKLRNSSSNQSGSTYIYAAFAENPFKTSRAR